MLYTYTNKKRDTSTFKGNFLTERPHGRRISSFHYFCNVLHMKFYHNRVKFTHFSSVLRLSLSERQNLKSTIFMILETLGPMILYASICARINPKLDPTVSILYKDGTELDRVSEPLVRTTLGQTKGMFRVSNSWGYSIVGSGLVWYWIEYIMYNCWQ